MISGTTKGGIVAKEGYSSSVIGIRELRNNYYKNSIECTKKIKVVHSFFQYK